MSEWRTIPGLPGYLISDEGSLISPMGRRCTRIGPLGNQYNVKNSDGTRSKVTAESLLKKAKRGKIVPPPIDEEDDVGIFKPKKRKCHDCGRPTWDYRCAECLKIWREKHDIPQNPDYSAEDFFRASYRGGGKHAHQE